VLQVYSPISTGPVEHEPVQGPFHTVILFAMTRHFDDVTSSTTRNPTRASPASGNNHDLTSHRQESAAAAQSPPRKTIPHLGRLVIPG